MAYIEATQFRAASVVEFTHDLTLTNDDVADDDLITAAITRLSARFDTWTDDHFESSASVETLEGKGGTRLYLPHRYTAVSQVRIRDEDGTWTVQDTDAYRLRSSLNAAGSEALGDLDYLKVMPGGPGLTGYPTGSHPWAWPKDEGSVEVTGTRGWTVTPGDVKRAVAILVYDHFKPARKDLRRAEVVQNSAETVRFLTPDPEAGIFSGIAEVDEIVRAYTRYAPPGAA